jgi:hypothetical protein
MPEPTPAFRPARALPYGRQHITAADVAAVTAALQGDFLTQGPTVAEFERQFAAYVGAQYAVAVSNGTAALHLCALALHVQPGQRVITSPLTFAASANCVRYCGGEVHFADIDPATGLIDLELVRRLLAAHPKGHFTGLIPVDFAGLAVNLEAARQLADEFGLWIIEDSCHAPGGFFVDSRGQEQRCGNGNFADLAIFSFHPVKHIATGEGGMITTNDEQLFRRLLRLRTHGITRDPADLVREADGGWYMEMQRARLQLPPARPDLLLGPEPAGPRRRGPGPPPRAWRATMRPLPARTCACWPPAPRPRLPPLRHSGTDRKGVDFLKTGDCTQVHYIPVTACLLRGLGVAGRRLPAGGRILRPLPQHPAFSDADGRGAGLRGGVHHRFFNKELRIKNEELKMRPVSVPPFAFANSSFLVFNS